MAFFGMPELYQFELISSPKEEGNMLKKSINSAISFVMHVTAVITPSCSQEKLFRNVRGLCGASDYGSFSAHSLPSD